MKNCWLQISQIGSKYAKRKACNKKQGGDLIRVPQSSQALHDGVEGCHAKFGGCTLLATESEPSVLKLIRAMELILQDQLKARPSPSVSANLRNLNVNSFSLR